MIKIRTGVFETNSSSCHSISISQGDYTSIAPDSSGVIQIPASDFGWEQETYTDPESKISYLMIYLRDWVEDNFKKELWISLLESVVLEHCHATQLVFEDGEEHGDGYIDHESVEGEKLNWIFSSADQIKNFVFSRNSVLETDNDNH